jgi:hypothetical protein
MNINNAFPSKWLKSGDAEEGDLHLTIRDVVMEDIGSGENQEHKPVLYFHETDKGMVLNKTNADTISKLYTPETDNWIGKPISVFATEVDFAGKQTLALRVRLRAPKSSNGTDSRVHDPVTAFWLEVKQRELTKDSAQHYLADAAGDFDKALELLKAQA